MPLRNSHNREVWRKTFLDHKAAEKDCTCFFETHARDFALLCLDELDTAYDIIAAQQAYIEALEWERKCVDFKHCCYPRNKSAWVGLLRSIANAKAASASARENLINMGVPK